MKICSFVIILLSLLSISCQTKNSKPSGTDKTNVGGALNPVQVQKNRERIEEHVRNLTENLVSQPVMTPRSGFSGYLAHFNVIRTTTKESPFTVIIDGEGHTDADTPAELQNFVDLKGAHPYGGTYAFSSNDANGVGKGRHDSEARLILEIPGPNGDGLMSIGFADGTVSTIKIPPGKFDDKTIQSILSIRGKP